MFNSIPRFVATLGKWLGKSRRPAARARTHSFRPGMEALESREVMTTSGWVAGLPPAHMTFATHTQVTLDPNTASKKITNLTVKDNVTRDVEFVAPTSGDYVIKTSTSSTHSAFDTVLGVYDVNGNRLAFNDDAPGTHFSALHITLQAGTKYEIGVGHFRGTAATDTLSRYCNLSIDGPDRVIPPVVDLGQKLVDWAHARLGQKVGDGQCSSLVDAALKAIGAKTFSQLGPTGLDDVDYVWGTKVVEFHIGDNVALLDQVRPGDIIQFRNVFLRHDANGGFTTQTFAHHTAIVEANLGGGNLRILQQNANGVQQVTEATLAFADMKQGGNFPDTKQSTIWIYRPIAA